MYSRGFALYFMLKLCSGYQLAAATLVALKGCFTQSTRSLLPHFKDHACTLGPFVEPGNACPLLHYMARLVITNRRQRTFAEHRQMQVLGMCIRLARGSRLARCWLTSMEVVEFVRAGESAIGRLTLQCNSSPGVCLVTLSWYAVLVCCSLVHNLV